MKSLPALILCVAVLLSGCSVWNPMASRIPGSEEPDAKDSTARLVGDLAQPSGMYPVKVEAVALVTQLRGTGSDPKPSPERALLMGEMRTLGIANPNKVLASPNTALVKVRGILRPGIQEGDRFDLEVRIPSGSETTSIRSGQLLETQLQKFAVMSDNRIHNSHPLGIAKGPILVDPTANEKEDQVMVCRGRVLGGGVALKSRPLLLALKPDRRSVFNSSRIDNAINKRFHTYYKGTKEGVANAQTDEYVILKVHPKYRDNIQRYVQVVRAVALRQSEADRLKRLKTLQEQLLDPISSARAALQLEAIGKQGIEALKVGIRSANPEVRFYSAEALAYLDDSAAAAVLAEIARDQPAFRVFALTALGAMDDYDSREELHNLLHVSSAETRYGAFRALSNRDPNDPVITGKELGNNFSYHVIDTSGPPMIHVTRSHRQEVVLFGGQQRLRTPLSMIEAGNRIMLTSNDEGEIILSRFTVNEPDQQRTVSDQVDEVIRAIAELGGTYPDVVQALYEAKKAGALDSRLEIDALPEAGRTYDRVATDDPAPPKGETEDKPSRGPLSRLLGKAR
jgi:flagellar basal body P-ring protein FlgI